MLQIDQKFKKLKMGKLAWSQTLQKVWILSNCGLQFYQGRIEQELALDFILDLNGESPYLLP